VRCDCALDPMEGSGSAPAHSRQKQNTRECTIPAEEPPGRRAVQAIPPERPARDAGPTMPPPASSHTPYRGGYRPGRGSGREPPPRQKEPCWPFHRAPAQEREFSWREPGRGATRGASPKHTFRRHLAMHRSPLSSTPHRPRVYPRKGRPGMLARPCLRWHHPTHRTVGDITRGGNPLPGKKNHTGPSTGLPPRSGSSRGESPGKPQTREGNPDSALLPHYPMHRSPLSPTPPAPSALLPHPGVGAVQVIPPIKPGPGCWPDHASADILPHTAPWGISPGEGLGEGTPSPAKRTILALPQGSRAGAGVLVARARAGRKPGEATLIPPFFHTIPCTALLSPPPRTGRVYTPGKAGPGCWPDHAFLPHHPIHRTERISPGEGLGEGTPSPAKRTILALP